MWGQNGSEGGGGGGRIWPFSEGAKLARFYRGRSGVFIGAVIGAVLNLYMASW